MSELRASWASDVETHRPIRGRRWRVSDPRIPEPLRQALVDELMDARRAVKAAASQEDERAARTRVHDAKVALGERGLRWWLAERDEEAARARVRHAARALERSCPEGWSVPQATAAVTSEAEDLVRELLG